MEEHSYAIKHQKLKGSWVVYLYVIAGLLIFLKYLYPGIIIAILAIILSTKNKMSKENKSLMSVNFALKSQNEGNMDDAKKYLKWAIEHDNSNKEAYLFLGSIYYDEGNYEKALEYLKNGDIDNSDNPKLIGILAMCYYHIKDYNLAIKYLEMITYPKGSEFESKRIYSLSESYCKIKSYNKSLDLLHTLSINLNDISESNVQHYYLLGVNYFYLKDYDKAKIYFNKVYNYDKHYKFVDMFNEKLNNEDLLR